MNVAASDMVASLARSAANGAIAEGVRQYITFTLQAREYGVDIMRVREIKGWTETTPLPQSPPHVRGVINLRGLIVPVLDLRARVGLGTTEPSRTHVLIIVTVGARIVALLVDGVSDIIAVEPDSVRPVPSICGGTEDAMLEGLIALDARMVTLVALEGLLDGLGASPAERAGN